MQRISEIKKTKECLILNDSGSLHNAPAIVEFVKKEILKQYREDASGLVNVSISVEEHNTLDGVELPQIAKDTAMGFFTFHVNFEVDHSNILSEAIDPKLLKRIEENDLRNDCWVLIPNQKAFANYIAIQDLDSRASNFELEFLEQVFDGRCDSPFDRLVPNLILKQSVYDEYLEHLDEEDNADFDSLFGAWQENRLEDIAYDKKHQTKISDLEFEQWLENRLRATRGSDFEPICNPDVEIGLYAFDPERAMDGYGMDDDDRKQYFNDLLSIFEERDVADDDEFDFCDRVSNLYLRADVYEDYRKYFESKPKVKRDLGRLSMWTTTALKDLDLDTLELEESRFVEYLCEKYMDEDNNPSGYSVFGNKEEEIFEFDTTHVTFQDGMYNENLAEHFQSLLNAFEIGGDIFQITAEFLLEWELNWIEETNVIVGNDYGQHNLYLSLCPEDNNIFVITDKDFDTDECKDSFGEIGEVFGEGYGMILFKESK